MLAADIDYIIIINEMWITSGSTLYRGSLIE